MQDRKDFSHMSNTILNVSHGVPFLTFKPLESIDFIRHAFSTKFGGVSTNEFSSMNLGFNSHETNTNTDSKENVLQNYKIFCKATNIPINDIVTSKQDHNTFVRHVTEKEKGIGIFRNHDMMSVDALVTDTKGLALVTYHADCTPIYFVDTKKKAIGLAHAGWRGTVGKIAEKTILKMNECFSTDPNNVICVIGPTIGSCCYEVNQDVAQQIFQIEKTAVKKIGNSKYMLDLPLANKTILEKCHVLSENIFLSGICTKCRSDILFSHRQTGGKRGTMIGILELKK